MRIIPHTRVIRNVAQRGQNCGFNPSLEKLSIKRLLAYRVSKAILKVGWDF